MTNPISDERLRNTLAWATARLGQLSGAEVIVGAITELLERRADGYLPGRLGHTDWCRSLNELAARCDCGAAVPKEWLPHEPTGEPDFRHLYECEKASKAVMQCDLDSLKADLHAMTNSAETLEALKTAHQALLEVAHAQDAGPEWYTRGASGLRQQVAMWVRRGLDALNKTRPVWQPENRRGDANG